MGETVSPWFAFPMLVENIEEAILAVVFIGGCLTDHGFSWREWDCGWDGVWLGRDVVGMGKVYCSCCYCEERKEECRQFSNNRGGKRTK